MAGGEKPPAVATYAPLPGATPAAAPTGQLTPVPPIPQ